MPKRFLCGNHSNRNINNLTWLRQVEIEKTEMFADKYMGHRLRQELARLGVSACSRKRKWWLVRDVNSVYLLGLQPVVMKQQYQGTQQQI